MINKACNIAVRESIDDEEWPVVVTRNGQRQANLGSCTELLTLAGRGEVKEISISAWRSSWREASCLCSLVTQHLPSIFANKLPSLDRLQSTRAPSSERACPEDFQTPARSSAHDLLLAALDYGHWHLLVTLATTTEEAQPSVIRVRRRETSRISESPCGTDFSSCRGHIRDDIAELVGLTTLRFATNPMHFPLEVQPALPRGGAEDGSWLPQSCVGSALVC